MFTVLSSLYSFCGTPFQSYVSSDEESVVYLYRGSGVVSNYVRSTIMQSGDEVMEM